ncbi:MAG TPA: right-handed parallel beta-helix repeat-containing protein [Anaerolineales bacterium]|nr:right-handed parallel beta-helix repeat-containing protein [Anaerolineales bacterium]
MFQGSGAQGGGILVGSTASLALNNSLVTSNAASTCPAFCGGGVKLLGVVTVNNSTISSNHGGGLHNDEGILTLNNTQVLDNTGGYGVAARSGGYLYFTGGSVNNNQGGGIYIKDAHAPTLTNLTISGNTLGGGLHNESSALMTPSNFTLTDSVVTLNGATSGGGVLNMGVGASATIRNTTLSYNTATSGGGVYNRTTLSLLNLTLYGNSASGTDTGGNIYNDGDSLAIKNTIVAGAGAGGNCFSNSGVINSGGHNLESTDTCGLAGTGDLVNTNPLLGPLQDNGGLTHTHALSVSSLAVNGGDNSGCPATDQRGVARPQGAACDIGAYEYIFDGPVDPFQIHLPLAYSG